MPNRILITGITGFVGSHLAEYFLRVGMDVYGTTKRRSRLDYIESIKNNLKLVECDVTDSYSVENAIKYAEPNYIFHLAAQSFVPTSWRAPIETLHTNIDGTLNILEAVRKLDMDTTVQIAGSSEEYGLVYPNEIPIREEKGLKESVIYVGNLEAHQDFTDVRDIVKAYLLAVVMCEAGEVYNICS